MSLIEETKPKLSPDVLQSMCRVNVELHDEIAQQMAEFELKNKVTVVPMGALAKPDPHKERSDSTSKGSKAGGETNKQRAKSKLKAIDSDSLVKRSNSGHQNITMRPSGSLYVQVGPMYCGS